MRCSNCYREIPEDALYCPYCGEAHPGAGMKPHPEVPPEPQMDEPEKQGHEPGTEQDSYHVSEKTINWVPYLVLAIISTICCCPPFGIVAIVYAVKISSEISGGYSAKAADSARKAKIWIIVAVAVGVVWDLIMLLFGLISAVNGYHFY